MIALTQGATNTTETNQCSCNGRPKPLIRLIKKKKTLSNKTSSKFCKYVIQQNNQLNTLNDIHDQFDVSPREKANGNIHRFYTLVLIKELGLDCNNAATYKTYISVHKTNNQITFSHTTF